MKDLSGDGKITKKDVLIGRGVIEKKNGGTVRPKARPKDLEKAAKKKRMEEEKRTKKRIIKEAARRRTRDHNTEPKQDIKSALGLANGGMVKKGYKNGGCVMAGRGGSYKGEM
jgi:hypothetical protein